MPAALLLVLPLLSALLLAFVGRDQKSVYRISLSFSLLTLISSLALLILWEGESYSLPLFGSRTLKLYIDPLSLVMGLTISSISFLVHAYSVRYMQDEPGYRRFFLLLDLMTFSILLTVLAGNALLMFVGWHLIGVFLYLLLGYEHQNPQSGRFALWTFLTHRFGDIPLLGALLLIFQVYGSFEFDKLYASASGEAGNTLMAELAGVLLMMSAFAKSAQVPLHLWLPYTMGGPTPVSALMHAGIVNAGGFLINRFSFLFLNAEVGLHLAFWVGLITAVLGSTLMLMQSDIKKSLGYSTVGQMGYMIMECGLGAFALAVYHLIAHGIFKATLFMGSGSVIHQARKDPNIPEDEIYKFLVERQMPPPKLPWVVFALITVSVPLAIVFLAHWAVGVDVFKYQGALLLLFFGWITGAQTIFSIYRLRAQNVYKTLLFVILSFSVVVMGYVVVGHSFEKFLYPDESFTHRIYENANINPAVFEIQALILTLIIVLGWLLVYYRSINRGGLFESLGELRLTLYTHLSRELYVRELFKKLEGVLLRLSSAVNKYLRWV